MSRHNAKRRTPLTLMELPEQEAGEGSAANGREDARGPNGDQGPLRRQELDLKTVAEELSEALMHLERATIASKGTGFTARVRDAFEEVDRLQRSASEEFGRKVGDRMGREALWRQRRGIDVD